MAQGAVEEGHRVIDNLLKNPVEFKHMAVYTTSGELAMLKVVE